MITSNRYRISLACLAILLTAATSFVNFVKANEVIGCGGFIKSNTEINYKIIKVKLLTKDGAVKYTTEASPVNGYYMIPIYNKGDYLLQVNPPLGWSFEPSQVSINVDGKSDPCSKNEDINFFFKGFGLSGKIVTKGDSSNQGPSGVKLILSQNGNQIGTALSDSDGSYYFSNVMPGTYQVEAQDPNLKFLQNKVKVELSKENWHAKENIVVSGYKIEGVVTSSDKTPISDAIIELHFSDPSKSNAIDTKNFECSLVGKDGGSKICQTKSDANGKFSFSNIAFGKYKLKANLAHGDSLRFGMRPESIDVELTGHKNLVLSESFRLDYVTVNSVAVLNEKNKPLESGEVFVNGKKTVDIKKDGKFTLEKLTSGTYKVEIKSKNIYFEAKTVRVDLSSAKKAESSVSELTKLKARSFDVCGRVKVNNAAQISTNIAKSVKIAVYSQSKLVKSAPINDDMSYCLQLDAGSSYSIKAELSDSMAQLLRLVPLERRVELVDAPLFDADFEQLEARLDGQIRLVSGKSASLPTDFKVLLKSVESTWSKEIPVRCVQVKDGPIECSFSQSNLLFGKYEMTTNYDDVYCWKPQSNEPKGSRSSSTIIINIDSETQMVRVEQLGFKLNVKLSHGNVNLKLVETKNSNVLFSRNILASDELSSTICLPQIADYRLLIESCHRFTANEPDAVDIVPKMLTRGENSISLIALKHKLNVVVSFKLLDLNDASFLKESDLVVEARTETQNELLKFKLKSSSSDELTFVGHAWFEANKQVRLVAKSDKVLFESNNLVKTIDEHDCASNLARFDAKLGIFITGSVSSVAAASLDGLELTVKSGDEIVEQSTVNAANGFKLGPFKAPISLYTLELAKKGYLFAKLSSEPTTKEKNVYEFRYQAEKLGSLKVNVVDAKQKTPLESVLMSLSSENRLFRQTIKTDATGHVTFDSLKPGLYYLIVMMQEYEFKPNSHPITISDGLDASLVVEANRVAYSCFGRVTSINGRSESERAVLVEARGLKSELDVNLEHDLCKSSRENAELDADGFGTYRIRNLKPNCVYELSVKRFKKQDAATNERNSGDETLKIVPLNYVFTVNNSDIQDRSFIVLSRNEQVDISLWVTTTLFTPEEWTSTGKQALISFVRVKLYRAAQLDTVLSTQYSPSNSMVYLGPVSRDEAQQYAVSVELLAPASSSATQQQLQQLSVLDKTEFGFYADAKHKHFDVRFDSDKRRFFSADYKQQYQTFYFTIPLFIIAMAIFLNGKKSKEIATIIFQAIQQREGLFQLINRLRGKSGSNATTVASQQQQEQQQTRSKSGKGSSSKSPRPTKESAAAGSDSERAKSQKKSAARSTTAEQPKPSESEESDFEDYTSEEGETLTIVKRKPRKID